MKIYVETEQLKSKSNQIKEIAYSMNENMNRIENLVVNLGLDWQGKSEIAYAAKILFVKKQFETLYSFINDYTDAINYIVNEYEDTENQITTQMEV